MSAIIGKGSRSFAKLPVAETSHPAVGFKKLVAKHEASAGDTQIDLGSLSLPAESAANGFVQPSLSDLTATNIQQFKENVTLSSGRGVWNQFEDYVITGANKITLLVSAEEGEIFTIKIDLEARTGNNIVDAAPISVTDILDAGLTDFSVGPFETNKFPNSQHGAVKVFVDGQLVYRNVNNQPDGDGDYYEVPVDGLSTVIRFNTADTEDRQVSVVSNGALVERPSGSQQAYLEILSGQIDAVIQTVADLAGVPETDFQANPNEVDLRAFGDRVIDLERLTDEATGTEFGTVKKNRWQQKFLSADVTTDNTDMGDIQFNNLIIGRTYRISGPIAFLVDATDVNTTVTIGSAAGGVGTIYGSITQTRDDAGDVSPVVHANIVFVAVSTSVYFRTGTLGAGSAIKGNGSSNETSPILEELNNYESTTDFS